MDDRGDMVTHASHSSGGGDLESDLMFVRSTTSDQQEEAEREVAESIDYFERNGGLRLFRFSFRSHGPFLHAILGLPQPRLVKLPHFAGPDSSFQQCRQLFQHVSSHPLRHSQERACGVSVSRAGAAKLWLRLPRRLPPMVLSPFLLPLDTTFFVPLPPS